MTIAPSTNLRKDLATLFSVGAIGLLSDAELLRRFITGESGSEAAFEMIVDRHGAMVLGVCRRILGDVHAANDAFQATFLILARKAPVVRVEDSLGRWLYGVSVRVAKRARANLRVERSRVQALGTIDPAQSSKCDEHDDVRLVIDEEIARLPARYRGAVVLCYLEGLTQEQAATRLGCPVGTVQSRLHRARERLRTRLSRRGLAPALWGSAMLASATARAEVPSALALCTTAIAQSCVCGVFTGVVPATVSILVSQALRGMIMSKGLFTGMLLLVGCLSVTGVGVVAGGADEPKKPSVDVPVPKSEPERKLSTAEQFAKIRAEFDAKQQTLWAAMEKVEDQREQNKLYQEMAPDDVAYCRRMIDLAISAPTEIGARDALVWVVHKAYRADEGPFGDEFARAAALLVRHHGDDPEAIRVGLGLSNVFTFHREALLYGFYASAKGHEAQGLAKMSLARYLLAKPKPLAGSAKGLERQKVTMHDVMGDDGKLFDKVYELTDEKYAYQLYTRLCDPDATRAEAVRLLNELIADYGDVLHTTIRHREFETLLKSDSPTNNGKILTEQELAQIKNLLAKTKTLAEFAEGHLDELNNVGAGKPAPEIDGVDIEGKPLKLSDYRGKVVVLVFWGSWCGPCMREVPHERELVERMKGKPFALLGVNCVDEKEVALKTMKDEGITWPNWHDGAAMDGPIVSRYHVRGYPTVMVIDPQGNIRERQVLLGERFNKIVDEMVQEIEAKDATK